MDITIHRGNFTSWVTLHSFEARLWVATHMDLNCLNPQGFSVQTEFVDDLVLYFEEAGLEVNGN